MDGDSGAGTLRQAGYAITGGGGGAGGQYVLASLGELDDIIADWVSTMTFRYGIRSGPVTRNAR